MNLSNQQLHQTSKDLEQLFSSDVVVCALEISDYTDLLFPEELQLVQTAVDKRKREFSTGRHCAHLALTKLGLEQKAIPRGTKRQPLWPKKTMGSISHSGSLAIAALSCDPLLISLGIDIEKSEPISEEVRNMVCTAEELEALAFHLNDPIIWKLIFSAKESLYKALYPLIEQWISFSQASLRFDFDNSTFKAELCPSLNIPSFYLQALKGRFIRQDDFLFTTVEISNT